jgi:hypothetical protein
MPVDDFYERLLRQPILQMPNYNPAGMPVGEIDKLLYDMPNNWEKLTTAVDPGIRIHAGSIDMDRLRDENMALRANERYTSRLVDQLSRAKELLEAELKGLYEICYALESELKLLKAGIVIDQPIVIRRHL